ncbi:glucose-1-phosphate adenylyltransferase subunit GlgD [Clostridium rectalis]|uniref:glucose-1-phosphate adenylyltransferase subunit GlgD n=1 Tax=Clostridium rectalis TaxID=2040295 RepID=UPI000F63E70D|nr:glucose-1-phosphate adenylyltransferase subunit GlgD [Clostridium rectalis]
MFKNYLGMIMLSEDTRDMGSLTNCRPIAAIPIGARYRIIDFILSNMVNGGIQNIGVFMQDNCRSLFDHLGTGKPWDLDRNTDGLFLFNFYANDSREFDSRMIKNNMEYFYRSRQENVIIASSYMICNIDFNEVINNHEKSGKDITIVYKKVKDGDENFLNCDVLNIDGENRVLSVGKNLGAEKEVNISMEILLMKKKFLVDLIYEFIKRGNFCSLKNFIYKNIKDYSVNAYEFTGYLRCVNSVNQYYEANMDLLDNKVIQELFFKNGNIYTKIKHEPPTRYLSLSKVSNSLIANGCLVEGTVENSIVARHVKIHKNAVVKNSIILQNCEICEGAHLNYSILDKNIKIFKEVFLRGVEHFPLVIRKNSTVDAFEEE